MWHLKKIPKIAHFYWGNAQLSYLRYLSLETFTKLNPDWQVYLHMPLHLSTNDITWNSTEQTNANITQDYTSKLSSLRLNILKHDFANEFSNSAHEVHKADFLRWKMLSTIGGIWSDIDIIYNHPMHCLKENTASNADVDTVLCPYTEGEDKGYHTIGFIFASSNNPFYKKIYSLAKEKYNHLIYQSIGTNLINKNYRSLEDIQAAFPELKTLFIDPQCVYSITYKTIDDFFTPVNKDTRIKINNTNVLGFHWYAGHPRSQAFESEYSEVYLVSDTSLISTVYKKSRTANV